MLIQNERIFCRYCKKIKNILSNDQICFSCQKELEKYHLTLNKTKFEFTLISGLKGSSKTLLSIALALQKLNISSFDFFDFNQFLFRPDKFHLEHFNNEIVIITLPKFNYYYQIGNNYFKNIKLVNVKTNNIFLIANDVFSFPLKVYYEKRKEYESIRVIKKNETLKIEYNEIKSCMGSNSLDINFPDIKKVIEKKEIFIPKKLGSQLRNVHFGLMKESVVNYNPFEHIIVDDNDVGISYDDYFP